MQKLKKDLMNNNIFRSASFRPRESSDTMTPEEKVKFTDRFQQVFGKQPPSILTPEDMHFSLCVELKKHEPDILEVRDITAQYGLPAMETIRAGGDLIREILVSQPVSALKVFTESYRQVKETITLSTAIQRRLDEPSLQFILEAKEVLSNLAKQLKEEKPEDEDLLTKINSLSVCLSDYDMHDKLPDLKQFARAVKQEWEELFEKLANERVDAYSKAIVDLTALDGWGELNSEVRDELKGPLSDRVVKPEPKGMSLARLRDQISAARDLLERQRNKALKIIEGDKVVFVQVSSICKAGIESPDQLEKALENLREEISRYIGQGKKVILR